MGIRCAGPVALSLLTLAACSRHEERELTAWLKVDVVRPATGTSGMIVLGSSEEVFHVKVGGRWKRLGSGHPCRYLLLNDPDKEYYEANSQPAALVDLNDRQGVQVVRAGEESLRPVKAVFGNAGSISVPPDRNAVDFFDCGEPAGGECRDLRIHRHDPAGTLVKTFLVPVPEAYPGCQASSVRWYDSAATPIVLAQCARGSGGPQCLWLLPRGDGLVVRAVGSDRPPLECSDPPGLNVALSRVERFVVLD